jgi:hypothetical protein
MTMMKSMMILFLCNVWRFIVTGELSVPQ